MKSRGFSLGQGGALDGFLVGKLGVALAALVLLGAALGMSSSFRRAEEMGEFAMVAEAIADAIQEAERLPGEVKMRKELPAIPHAKVTILGERDGGLQVIRVTVESNDRVERILVLATRVNDGKFTLSRENPSTILLHKSNEILLELI